MKLVTVLIRSKCLFVLQFVDSNCDIREDFIRFVHCDEGLSGKEVIFCIV